ncbi:MAG: hypothetical protein ABGZ35_16190 [Planctomycetaceae bacterium]
MFVDERHEVTWQAVRIAAVGQHDRIVPSRQFKQPVAVLPNLVLMFFGMNLDADAVPGLQQLGCLRKGLVLMWMNNDPLQQFGCPLNDF